MTPLGRRLAGQIAAAGPMSVAEYMAHCLYDPDHGYYTTREPFGRAGDFTTAPEISQMFGEMIGVWIATVWQSAGAPEAVAVAEIGPGRGTLMKDMTRTLARIAPGLSQAARFVLIETSPRLRDVQAQTLRGSPGRFEWNETVDVLPATPTIFVGNEIFDAIPIRQYVRTGGAWRERLVGLDAAGDLAFVAGAGAPDPALLPPDAASAREGAIVDIAPARSALMQKIAEHIAAHRGAGLFLDYGHPEPGVGDTLQAVRNHRYDDPLAHPGEADITTHVDFAALADEARRAGLGTFCMTQGDFLLRMGLAERAGRLGAGGDAELQRRLAGEVERLVDPKEMGNLFKVMAVLPLGMSVTPFTPD